LSAPAVTGSFESATQSLPEAAGARLRKSADPQIFQILRACFGIRFARGLAGATL
jgi:hypothetical protein